MSVYMRFSGGIGNQMFQYAFLYSLMKNSDDIIHGCMCHSRIETPKQYALDCFKLSLNIEKVDQVGTKFVWNSLVIKKKILFKFYSLFYQDDTLVYQKLLKHNIIALPSTFFYASFYGASPQYIEGCFQTPLYFANVIDEIRREFTIKIAPSVENFQLINELQRCESVCVHVRRGDYLSSHWAEELAVCDLDYYMRGIEEIKHCVENPKFYIFSNSHNDIEWIKDNWDLGDVKYVDLGNPDYEDLRLMYSCKHFVISNSTYSWWAQFLAPNPNKIVVAPSIWNRKNKYSEKIYMSNWHIIEV